MHWHKWGRWGEIKILSCTTVFNDTGKEYPSMKEVQYRECEKCGSIQRQVVSGEAD